MRLIFILMLSVVCSLAGCAASFEESAASHHSTARAVSLQLSERCVALSDRARWEGGVAKAGVALTGSTGIITIPVKSETGRAVLVGSVVLLAAGTIALQFLSESDASAFVSECTSAIIAQ